MEHEAHPRKRWWKVISPETAHTLHMIAWVLGALDVLLVLITMVAESSH